jgi:hypothetical protein
MCKFIHFLAEQTQPAAVLAERTQPAAVWQNEPKP